MSLLDKLRSKRIPNVEIVEKTSDYYDVQRVGSLEFPDRLTDLNAFTLANTVSELYNPIDFLADRASKLRFYIADKNGVEVENTELNRFINNINPFYSFSDLFYQSIFTYLADGNIHHYTGVSSMYKKVNASSISRIDVLNPTELSIQEFCNISTLKSISLNDLIKRIEYCETGSNYADRFLEIEKYKLYTYDMTRRTDSLLLSKSPLNHAFRSINNLLATYSARYNVYANNGAAGYLSKKTAGNGGIDSMLTNRDDMLKDINNRNGITGNRNFWGISSVPIEFVNTLGTIKDLMPFEETLEDSIKIASIFQIPANLVPRKDQSTFNNQLEAERSVWENTLMSIVDTVCSYFTKSFVLDKIGYQIKADYSTVSALKTNDVQIEDLRAKKIANLKLIKEISPETNIQPQIDLILKEYE